MERPELNTVQATIEQLTGRVPDSIEAVKPPSGGLESWSYRVSSSGQALWLKINHSPDTMLGIHFNQRLREANIPTPEVVAWSANADPIGLPCVLSTHVAGDQANWLQIKMCPYDESQCGSLLRQIHSLEFDGPYCFLGDAEPISTLCPITEDCATMFPCEHAARRCLELGWLAKSQADTLAKLPDLLSSELGSAPKRLLHMDFLYNGNLILETGTRKIIAAVDGAEAMAGDPRLELAYFDYGFPGSRWPFNMAAFREGYGTHHDPLDDLNRFYMVNLLLFTRFAEGDLNIPMATPNILLLQTLLRTFE